MTQQITVNVKTLHGQRKTHSFQVSIFDKIDKICDKLREVEPEDMKAYSQPRLVYPVGKIRILNLEDSIEKVELKANCTLVLMGLTSFVWDPNRMDRCLKVSLH